jgi:hypothetical protein
MEELAVSSILLGKHTIEAKLQTKGQHSLHLSYKLLLDEPAEEVVAAVAMSRSNTPAWCWSHNTQSEEVRISRWTMTFFVYCPLIGTAQKLTERRVMVVVCKYELGRCVV